MKKRYALLTILCINYTLHAKTDIPKTYQCTFLLNNDSKFTHIYASTNPNLATIVNKQILKKAPDTAQVSNIKNTKPARLAKIDSEYFYIYAPTTQEGQFMQLFKVQASDWDAKPFKLKYSQLAKNEVDPRLHVINQQEKIPANPRFKRRRQGRTVTKVIDTAGVKNSETAGVVEKSMPAQPEYEVRPGGYDMYIP